MDKIKHDGIITRVKITKKIECEFFKYTSEVIEGGPHKPYGRILNKCKCPQCMAEKEYNKKYRK